MPSFKPFYAFPLASAIFFSHSLLAGPVAEWKFDQADEVTGGAEVKLDLATSGAKGTSLLMDKSVVSAAPTELGSGWKPFLSTGFLESQRGSTLGQHGLVTDLKPGDNTGSNYRAYMGFTGFGSGTAEDGKLEGGTIYLVVSPADWAPGARYGLFGTGHAGEGAVALGIAKTGALTLRAGSQNGGASTAAVTQEWKPAAWYFVAGTWREGEPITLLVQEMSKDGPKAFSGASVTATDPVPKLEQPQYDPIAIGANWYDPGDNPGTNDGANARLAWARLDNNFSTEDEMKAVFQSLGK